MSKINVKGRVLVHTLDKLLRWQQSQDIEFYFHFSKVKEWHNKNGERAKAIIERMRLIDKEYLETDEKGEYKKDEKGEWLCKEGKTMEEFNKAYDDELDKVAVMEV